MPDETPEQPPPQPEAKPPRPRFQPRRQQFRRPQAEPQPPGEQPPAVGEEPQRPQQRPQNRPQHAQRPQPHSLDITVLIPLYNEEESLRELHKQLRETLSRMNSRYELIFVDDGSTDKSFQILRDLKRLDHRISIIRFRRNFGKSAALAVGFDKAQGRIVITMDADLQDDPAEIPGLVRKISEGYDLVSGWKKVRRDPLTKTIPSRFFNFVTGVMTGIKLHDFNCGLKAYRNEVVKSVKVYGELHRYIPALASWEGFTVSEIPVNHRARKFGKTKFGLGRFWKGFLDLLTMLFTTRYFRRPLHLFGLWGIVFALAGLVIDGVLIVEKLMGETSLSNRPLFLVGILGIIVGIQFVSIGLLGEMISKSKQSTEEYAIRDYIK